MSNTNIADQNKLMIAHTELAFQKSEYEKLAVLLGIANKELVFKKEENEKLLAELIIANKELVFRNDEKEKIATELSIANKELAFQNEEKGKVESTLLENESLFYTTGANPSEQKKVENVLKESDEKFKLIFEKSIAPIIVADDKGNYLEVNKAAAEIFEYSIDELMAMNVGDLITTSNANAAAHYEEYIRKGEEIGEFGFISKKGTPKIVQYQAVRIKPDFNLSVLMDVTEQKQAPKYARSLIEASLDPLVTISADGKITDVNEASIKVTGVERRKLIDTDFSNYFTEPQKAQEGYQQVFEKGFVSDYPLTIKHRNGTLTDVLYNASVYKDSNGNVLGVFAAARDVTSQKQASQYARSLIEASLDPLVTISAGGKILDVNAASIKVTGIPREKLIDTDFSNYFTEPQKAQEGYLQVFEKGYVSDYPLTIKHKDGNLTDVLYNASVYKDIKGNVLGVFAAARDVTEQKWAKDLRVANTELAFQNKEKEKRAAELSVAIKELAFQNDEKEKRAHELTIANKELSFQNEEKEKRAAELIIANKELLAFTYVSSHDLQEPLRKIQTFASVILKNENENLSDNGKYNFQRMQLAAGRMQQLIEDLLAFSRISTTDHKFENSDLNIIIKEIKVELKDTIKEKYATIEASELCSANIIPFQFRQLMYNLISNALKFAHANVPSHIVIKSRIEKGNKLNSGLLSPGKEYCHVTVKDNGIGFEPHFSERIFEVFQKLHSKEEYAGTGIGLAIVKKIVENHNGVITAKSELNEGATFDIYIPAA